MSKQYQALLALSKSGQLLADVGRLLAWDQETYMPQGAIAIRTAQIEYMASLAHAHQTSATFRAALEKLIDLDTGVIQDHTLTEAQKAAVYVWRRDFLQATKLPNAFVKEFAKTTAQASHVWADARRQNRFRTFAPLLKKIVALCQEKATLLGYQAHPYDALVDLYEPDMKTATLHTVFATLKPFLTALTHKISQKTPEKAAYLQGDFPEKDQMEFNYFLLKTIGVDPQFTRLDQSAHPFCSGMHPHDVRLTTYIRPTSLMENIFAVLHEGGHALYELGLPPAHYGSPLGDSISLGIHESQSRWWEIFIGKSYPFWQFMYPKLQAKFPSLQDLALDSFYSIIHLVQPSLIRIHADEVTYTLHIMLRFELEKELIEGKLQVDDLPDAWNAKMQELLGITPPNDQQGCLQDIHWSSGTFGYFPAYALGNIYAAQFFASFTKSFPDWQKRVAQGEFRFIREWLLENIHCLGRQYTSAALLQRITGEALSITPYQEYLTHKYAPFHLRS